jgi:hypothetical protein
MLRAINLRISRDATPEYPKLFGTAVLDAKKGLKAFPQGLKPTESQALNVGAKAPTP